MALLATLAPRPVVTLPHCQADDARSLGRDDWERALAGLHRGMSAAEVRDRLGAPRRIARQLIYHRYLEQWLYDAPRSARLEFECNRGQPVLLIEVAPAE
jgi:hypothetical protein